MLSLLPCQVFCFRVILLAAVGIYGNGQISDGPNFGYQLFHKLRRCTVDSYHFEMRVALTQFPCTVSNEVTFVNVAPIPAGKAPLPVFQ